jgi:hypothetical protein
LARGGYLGFALSALLAIGGLFTAWASFGPAPAKSYATQPEALRQQLYDEAGWNQTAGCIDVVGNRPALRWNSAVSTGWISTLGALIATASFTGITILLGRSSQRTFSDPRLTLWANHSTRDIAFAWLASTLIAGVVVTFMFSQLSGENECSTRSSLTLAAGIGLAALAVGFLVSLEWLLVDSNADEPQVFLLLLYGAAISGIAVYAAISVSGFMAWPDYNSTEPHQVAARASVIVAGSLAGVFTRNSVPDLMSNPRLAEYMSISVVGVSVVGLFAFVIVQGAPPTQLDRFHSTIAGVAYCAIIGGLLFFATVALPPYVIGEPDTAEEELQAGSAEDLEAVDHELTLEPSDTKSDQFVIDLNAREVTTPSGRSISLDELPDRILYPVRERLLAAMRSLTGRLEYPRQRSLPFQSGDHGDEQSREAVDLSSRGSEFLADPNGPEGPRVR